MSSNVKIMKKLILVSLVEFLELGGKVERGMKIYREHKMLPIDPKNADKLEQHAFGELIQSEPDSKTNCYLLKNSMMKSFPLSQSLGYVLVEVRVEPIAAHQSLDDVARAKWIYRAIVREFATDDMGRVTARLDELISELTDFTSRRMMIEAVKPYSDVDVIKPYYKKLIELCEAEVGKLA